MNPVYLIIPYPNLKLRGGILSYILNLRKILQATGHIVEVLCIGEEGHRYRYATGVSRRKMLDIARDERSLIINAYRDLPDEETLHFNIELIRSGAPFVVHDTRIANDEVLSHADHLVCMGKNITEYYRKQGKRVTRVPMPYYWETLPSTTDRHNHGVTVCRVDKQKNIEMVTEINRVSPTKIYISSRREMRYVNFVLNRKYPGWDKYYLGSHEDNNSTSVEICALYKFAVDLSILPRPDMGRVQYAFLEAMHAGTTLVIHKEWERGRDEMIDGVNCIAVATPDEFVERLEEIKAADFRVAYKKILTYHRDGVSEKFMEVIEKR